MPLDPAAQAIADELLNLYQAAQAEIDELIAAAADTTTRSAAYRSRLIGLSRAVTEAMADLDDAARDWTAKRLPAVYQLGAQQASTQIGERFNWTLLHREAIQQLAADTFDDLLGATRHVRGEMKTFIRQAARDRSRAVLIQGDTATRAGRALATRLRERGIAAVTYRNGARHSLRDYSDVAIRTKTATAFNTGTLNAGREHGVRWVQVLDGTGCGWDSHGSTDTANGSVRSLRDAEAHPISHPRCARSFALLPVKTKVEAERLAKGDYSGLPGGPPAPAPAPAARKAPAAHRHQQRLEKRQALIATRTSPSARTRPPGTAAPADRVTLKGKATKFEPLLDQIGQLHSVGDAHVSVTIGGATTRLGGKYKPATRGPKPRRPSRESFRQPTGHLDDDGYRAAREAYNQRLTQWANSPFISTISINTRNGDVRGHGFTFLHEYGHHIDMQSSPNAVSRLDAAAGRLRNLDPTRWGTDPKDIDPLKLLADDPEVALLAKLRQTSAYQDLYDPRDITWTQYARSPRELWARSYSQWAARTLDDPDLLHGLRNLQDPRYHGYHWSDEEFDSVMPFVEAVLRKWGLIVDV